MFRKLTAIYSLMASKPLAFCFIVFLMALLNIIHYLRLRQLHAEFQNAASYRQLERINAQNPNWFEVVARELGAKSINIGLVNMDDDETAMMDTKGEIVKVDFSTSDDQGIKWPYLFPGWINEINSTRRRCPELPMPEFKKYEQLDVVVARVPCNESEESGTGLRDVFRLHVNLVVANLLVRSGRKGSRPIYAVFIAGSCGPMWEIFRCDDLVLRVGDSWIYKPQLSRIKQKVLMPVGSCQLTPPLARSDSGEELWREKMKKQRREAYATVLHSSEAFVCGAIALAQSIIQSNSSKDLVLLADDHISPTSLNALRSTGWKIKRIERIRSPFSKKNTYNEWNYSKLRLWQLHEYDKVMFIDSDIIVTRNIDDFFIYPQISAVGNARHIFNSGVMLVEPSACTFKTLMERRWLVRSYNGGDQGFLNEMFPWWHRLPGKMNRLKYFDGEHRVLGDAYAVHYLGIKPWMCYRDYDCNWDMAANQHFASDVTNERWWRLYDSMPEKLRGFCGLTPQTEARIIRYRNKAKDAKLADAHWKIKIKDPRQNQVYTKFI